MIVYKSLYHFLNTLGKRAIVYCQKMEKKQLKYYSSQTNGRIQSTKEHHLHINYHSVDCNRYSFNLNTSLYSYIMDNVKTITKKVDSYCRNLLISE